MTPLLLFLTAFGITYGLASRSLPLGIAALITVGYFHGLIRANVVSPFTSFMFDASLFALYLGATTQCPALRGPAWRTPLGRWVQVLILCAILMALVPVNHWLIRLVAIHASVWFALMLMIGSQVNWSDVMTVGRWVALLNIVALGFGIYIFVFGVPSLYPLNAVTQFTYNSRDVAGGEWRIPSTFLEAHAYGGTMLMSAPFLAAIGFEGARVRDRLLAALGTTGALGGLLLCGARQPVVVAAVAAAITLLAARGKFRLLLFLITLAGVATIVGSQSDRFQRIMTLSNTEVVRGRVEASVNAEFLNLVLKYPLGAGMGSAFGTNVPSFLAEYAPARIIGLENEYSNIQVNQGVTGLALWIAFLLWNFLKVPRRLPEYHSLALTLAYGTTLAVWLTAWIGGGTRSSVPMSPMMFLLQGIVVTIRNPNSEGADRSPPAAAGIHGIRGAPLKAGAGRH